MTINAADTKAPCVRCPRITAAAQLATLQTDAFFALFGLFATLQHSALSTEGARETGKRRPVHVLMYTCRQCDALAQKSRSGETQM